MENKFNILLDPLPQEWNGYPIDSDFQTGIQMYWIMEDGEMTVYEKVLHAGRMLFPKRLPESMDDVAEAIAWFLQGWNTDHPGREKQEKPVMDFQMDQWRIWAAFRRQYQIDLNKDILHFWVFMALLRNLDECSLTRVAEIRGKKLGAKMSAEERKAYAEAKAIYALDKQQEQHEFTPGEIEMIDAFDAMHRKAK